MKHKRKQYVVDKKYQYRTSLKSAVASLCSLIVITAILIGFAHINNMHIEESNKNISEIVDTQNSMIEMFLEIPVLQESENPAIKNGEQTFRSNIGKLKMIRDRSERIVQNGRIIIIILIILTIVQAIIIYVLSIVQTHRVSGPIFVMRQQLQEILNGKQPQFRPLRKNDELKDFYGTLQEVYKKLSSQSKTGAKTAKTKKRI